MKFSKFIHEMKQLKVLLTTESWVALSLKKPAVIGFILNIFVWKFLVALGEDL